MDTEASPGSQGAAHLETSAPPPDFQDLNLNGIDDTIDILTGTSLDEDGNGLPDDGEAIWPAPVDGQG